MPENPRRIPFGWIAALLLVVLVAALPAAWAGPLAEPARQTIPGGDPTPTPRTPVVVCKLIEPCEFATMTVPLENEGTLAMEGCELRLEEAAAIEYRYQGQTMTAPYVIPIRRLLPGETVNVSFEAGLLCDDPAALPCTMYVLDVTLVCGEQSSLVDQICIDSPCPVLPSVGK
ncbi:MAG: hypothetical protein GXX94_06205 [Chloroflexi bacterium]|nr:hypothetical protein [Chloroflexota bacterium]